MKFGDDRYITFSTEENASISSTSHSYSPQVADNLFEISVVNRTKEIPSVAWINLTPDQIRNEFLPDLCALLDAAEGNTEGTTRIYTRQHQVLKEEPNDV